MLQDQAPPASCVGGDTHFRKQQQLNSRLFATRDAHIVNAALTRVVYLRGGGRPSAALGFLETHPEHSAHSSFPGSSLLMRIFFFSSQGARL